MLFPMSISFKIFKTSPIVSKLWLVTVISSQLFACQPQNEEQQVIELYDDIGKVFITDTAITVQPEHIAHIKSERYQPSLSLYGRLIPIKQVFIRSQQTVTLLQVAVKQGDKVKKGQLLLSVLPNLSVNNTDNSNINNTNKNTGSDHYDNDNDNANHDKDSSKLESDTKSKYQPIEITAPFSGKIQHLYYQQEDVFNRFTATVVTKNQPLMILSDDTQWRFVSQLPAYTKSKLSIGQHVNFSLRHDKNNAGEQANKQHAIKLTGQISDITTHKDKAMSVTVHVLPNRGRPFPLKQGMAVQGKVDYGQIEVGTLIAKAGVHPILTHETYGGLATDLSVFNQPNAHVVAPVKAYVWIVNHDRKLKRQVVDVIRYDKQSQQYLVAGIPNEVLICLVDLPASAEGRLLRVS